MEWTEISQLEPFLDRWNLCCEILMDGNRRKNGIPVTLLPQQLQRLLTDFDELWQHDVK